MNWLQQFRYSLKRPEIEELIDIIFFRPMAFLLTKALMHTSITPNQISFIAMIFGLLTGYIYSFGTARSFVFGALCYAVNNVLDGADGMIARLKKNGTNMGRIIDGSVDYVKNIALFLGWAVGLSSVGVITEYPIWLTVVLTGLSAAIQCLFFDLYRNEYLNQLDGKDNFLNSYIRKLDTLKDKDKKLWEKILIQSVKNYSHTQKKLMSVRLFQYDRYTYERFGNVLIKLWGLMGPATQSFIVIISSLLYTPTLLFNYVLIFSNILMAGLFTTQFLIKKYNMIKVGSVYKGEQKHY